VEIINCIESVVVVKVTGDLNRLSEGGLSCILAIEPILYPSYLVWSLLFWVWSGLFWVWSGLGLDWVWFYNVVSFRSERPSGV